jgi:hypothetical protein
VIRPDGVVCSFPTFNGEVANLCFRGANFDTMFATCGDRVYKSKVKARGINAYQEPHKPAPPRL